MMRRASDARRRAARFNVPHVAYAAQDIYEREHGVCSICNSHVDMNDFHIDHIIPLQVRDITMRSFCILSHPGDAPWNVTVTHPSCNGSKGNRMSARDSLKYFRLREHYQEWLRRKNNVEA